MLNSAEFWTLTQIPALATPPQLQAVKRLTEDMEWFADAQITLLKIMRQQDPPAFDKHFPRLSLYATNRNLLMEYLRGVAR